MSHLTFLLVSTVLLGIVRSSPINSRVLGGSDAAPKQFPHQISLRLDHSHICGGSVISKRHVLTAAHCVVAPSKATYPPERFTIRAGTVNRIAGGVILPVKRIQVHPDYVIYNDLAIIELQDDLTLSDSIQPIELFEGEVPENSNITISGWGLTVHAGADLPIYLQYNKLIALSKAGCAKKIGYYTDALICLSHEKGAGACNGDSGGPATYDGKLVGVAGFVILKCGGSRPDGYAKISYNTEWIKENMI